jgi:hypothetical protein
MIFEIKRGGVLGKLLLPTAKEQPDPSRTAWAEGCEKDLAFVCFREKRGEW